MSDREYFEKQDEAIRQKEFNYLRELIGNLFELCEFQWLSGADVISRLVIDDLPEDVREAIKRSSKLRKEARNKLDEWKKNDAFYGARKVQRMYQSEDFIRKYNE